MKRVALFGAGRIGRIHAANLAALPGVELALVSDPMADAARELAGRHGAQVAQSIEAVFADASIAITSSPRLSETPWNSVSRLT